MDILKLTGISIDAIYSCLPRQVEDNLACCSKIYGSESKGLSIVKATGIKSRRVVDKGVTSLDLCVSAAGHLINDLRISAAEIGAVVDVTFTPARTMPCNACQAQAKLKLPKGIAAFDINLACSGWIYGLYVAGMFAQALGRKVLLLDGDTQTTHMDRSDIATVPVMADAGTATLISPGIGASDPWKFSFLTDGEKGDALTLPFGGTISMNGLEIFKFVTMDVLYFIRDFLAETGFTPETLDAFCPHQANIFMIKQIAKKLKFIPEQLWISGDVLGNSSSATVPTTIASCAKEGASQKVLISGFGGGLSASVAFIELSSNCKCRVFDYGI